MNLEQIFLSHFPSNPVLPAACIVSMAMSRAEEVVRCRLLLTEAHDVKFLSVITPDIDKIMECRIADVQEKEECVSFRATFVAGEKTYARMRLTGKKSMTKQPLTLSPLFQL